ncbi:MAG: 4-hydroxyphenylpyruvate dioxygenase [Acidobacteria bacterium]|nr:4-hydroxyphenylpyruvate dioxygenase [Acidobacteriota bacterium]
MRYTIFLDPRIRQPLDRVEPIRRKEISVSQDPLQLKRIHHVEFWVGNAKQAAFFYRNAFGFSQVAYKGLETGERECTSYALEQSKARLVLTTAMGRGGPMNDFIVRHGDGVRDIAFEVADADAAYAAALERGAEGVFEPHDLTDGHGTVRRAAIQTYGDTIHSLISKKDYTGPFLPGYVAKKVPTEDSGLLVVDHIVGNVELGKMNYWADWYSKILGFERYITFDDKDISTEYSALMSIVMSDDSRKVKFPINEPAEGRKKSQIEEYLDYNNGPGVQHLALLTGDIIKTVRRLKENGIEFLEVPGTYYDELSERVGDIDESVEAIRELGILVDRDEDGYLLQLFTKPVEDRPTLFFEIIQRKGSRGFGKGNFKALFESIEREQALRGNL